MVKNSTLAVILAALIISVALTAEADGAGLVWRAINKANSSIHDIANVTEHGCALNQILKVNSTADWACATDDNTNSGFSTIASMISPNGNATILAENSTTRAVFKTISVGTGLSILNGSNSVVLTNTVTDTDTGFTNLASTGITNATVIATNGTSSTRASFKTISAGTGIQIDNGTDSVIIKSTVVDTDTTNISSLPSNSTLVFDNSTANNKVIFKNISAGAGIQIDNGTNSIIISNTAASGSTSVLTGGNLTSATTASYRTIFTIPLTANSGNYIHANIIATGELGSMAQYYANYTTSNNNWGNCAYLQPSAATTISQDVIPIVTLGGAVVDTGGTTQLNANATSVLIDCAILSGANPGSVSINFQTSTINNAVHILNGSSYTKTP